MARAIDWVFGPRGNAAAVESRRIAEELDLTARLPATNRAAGWTERLLTTLHQRIRRSLAAAVDIAAHAPPLVSIAADTERRGRELADISRLIASASAEVATTLDAELVPGAAAVAALSGEVAGAIRGCAADGRQVLEQVDAIDAGERDVAAAIQRLEHQLTEVAQVIGVIAGVSRQINLLSLNAAIEAARAGPQGWGFAVVADEVRKLALHTTTATEEVAAIVERFRGDMDQLVRLAPTCTARWRRAGPACSAWKGDWVVRGRRWTGCISGSPPSPAAPSRSARRCGR